MFKNLTLFGLVLAVIVVTLGTYLNFDLQGLGCAEGPLCYGKQILEGNKSIEGVTLVQQNLFSQIHTFLAAALGLVSVLIAGFSFRVEKQRLGTVFSSLWLLILVAGQAWLGQRALVSIYQPTVVTLHLLLGFLTVWSLGCLYFRSLPSLENPRNFKVLNLLVWVAQGVLILEIVLGSWVSSNLGGFSCQDFPRCDGEFLTPGSYAAAFNFLPSLISENLVLLNEMNRKLLMSSHYVFTLVVFLIVNLVMLNATNETEPRSVRRAGSILSLLLLLEILFGVFSVKHALPIGLVLAHSVVASLLMLPLIAIARFSRYGLLPADAEPQLQSETVSRPIVQEEPHKLYQRLSHQLSKTRGAFGGLLGRDSASGDLIEQIETTLLMADLGIETTQQILQHLTRTLDKQHLADPQQLVAALKNYLYAILEPCSQPLVIPKQDKPYVMLVVGVNGAGKTTSIGKLAHRLQTQGHSVMLAAGDTFRAAAVEQLQTWGERNNVHVVAQHTGADSASVIFDGLQSAQAKGVDVLIADTAGRLHTKSNLMDELKKIKRIMSKLDDSAPHEVLLVLDAGTGQNALSQARQFDEAVQLTGIALTKLDGTAKGGIIFALAQQLQRPIRFIGVGEAMTDLQDFDARSFVDALFDSH